MSKVLGFIGNGNMGKAMIGGIIGADLFKPEEILVSDIFEEGLKRTREEYKVLTTTDNKDLAKKADLIVLSIKPNLYPIIMEEIRNEVKDDVIIITIAAGKSIESTEECFGRKMKVVRVMPNTPALVGEGMSALSFSQSIEDEDRTLLVDIFESFGRAEIVGESLMDAVTAVSGSSPAYVYLFIEALADGAVIEGMPRDQAYRMAAQAVLGSAKMVLETGRHPGDLKDMVSSPGGTTIEAVAKLEEKGFRDGVISAVRACADKSREMSK